MEQGWNWRLKECDLPGLGYCYLQYSTLNMVSQLWPLRSTNSHTNSSHQNNKVLLDYRDYKQMSLTMGANKLSAGKWISRVGRHNVSAIVLFIFSSTQQDVAFSTFPQRSLNINCLEQILVRSWHPGVGKFGPWKVTNLKRFEQQKWCLEIHPTWSPTRHPPGNYVPN